MSPTLPQPAPLQVQTLEAGKGLARLFCPILVLSLGWIVAERGLCYLAAAAAAAAAASLQSCPTLCDPIDGSPPGSPVPGILQQEHWSELPFSAPMHESEK